MHLSRALVEQLSQTAETVRKLVYGMTAHEIVLYTLRMRADMETLFILITLGDLIGVPILPPYYSLRLLPYLTPQISTWKRQVLRERDFLEAQGLDLLG